MDEKKRHLLTAALPYANGPVHIGHLAGVYIPADIYARYLRLRGKEVLFVCGSDEHGVPITIKAKQEGVEPKDIVDRYHGMISSAFEQFGISFDIYSRTTSPMHFETSAGFFNALYEKGELQEKVSKQYFDQEAMQFLADRYIEGTCPHCAYDHAYGDQCESCGSSLSPTELIKPKSMLTGSDPVLKETKHWYLPLDKHEQWLKEWILEGHKEWKSNVYGQCKSWLDQGLQPRAVSRDLNWGVPLPIEEGKGKVLYVWFDAPIGYISATRELAEKKGFDWREYWMNKDTSLIHFIGKDNIVFHCIVFPAMLKAHGDYILPQNVPGNEFLNLEGDKISTSRNWAVWLHEYLQDFPGKEDVLRYVLCANAPETKDNDFTWVDFQDRNNNELVAILGNFVNRALVLTHKYYGGLVPAPGVDHDCDLELMQGVAGCKEKLEIELEHFRFREALRTAMQVARLGNKYLADTAPWKLAKSDPDRVQTILYYAIQVTANLAIILEPFMPKTADRLWYFINMKKKDWNAAGTSQLVLPEHPLRQPELLFDKIDDEVIIKQKEKLHKVSEAPARIEHTPVKVPVSFDDFMKMDIRTATILEASRVPKTKKLLKILLDTGLDTRTVVSGIAAFFDLDELPGKQVLVLLNLAPRAIKGIDSQGMILMAEDENGQLGFVSPEKMQSNGSMIR